MAVLAVLAAVIAPSAGVAGPLDDPAPGSPQWYARSAADFAHSHQRGLDMETNPDYQMRFLPLLLDWLPDQEDPSANARINTDPFRLDWGPPRGTVAAVSYPNRYGARISAHVWAPSVPFTDPVTGAVSNGPFPALIVVNGYGAFENSYWGMAQSLAEAGYVVMTFDPQGQGLSDVYPNPREVYCDPDGSWRDPQEMGIREQGECAGVDPEGLQAGSPVDLIAAYVDEKVNGVDWGAIEASYALFRPRFVLGALDAAAWLTSEANPTRDLVDATRIGVSGHSAGADGAIHAGNGDPLGRFDAAVTWDGYGGFLDTVDPTVPTLLHYAESQEFGPHLTPPSAADHEVHGRIADGFEAAGVDSSVIVLRGSTHQEWTYVPHPILNPFCTPFCNASALGQRVAVFYTQAWFDLNLKGLVTEQVRGDEAAQAADARGRLLASVFDDSVDASSIGHGTWDPSAASNAPYRIASEKVRDHLSLLYPSRHRFDDIACPNIREGC